MLQSPGSDGGRVRPVSGPGPASTLCFAIFSWNSFTSLLRVAGLPHVGLVSGFPGRIDPLAFPNKYNFPNARYFLDIFSQLCVKIESWGTVLVSEQAAGSAITVWESVLILNSPLIK